MSGALTKLERYTYLLSVKIVQKGANCMSRYMDVRCLSTILETSMSNMQDTTNGVMPMT